MMIDAASQQSADRSEPGDAPTSASPRVFDWKSAAKALAKALAKATASAIVRGVFAVGLALVSNLAFVIVFFVERRLMGGGHGGLVLFPLALLPFAPFVLVAAVIAQKQGVARLLAAAVESQGPALARLASHYLGRFLEERYGDLRATRAGGGLDRAWSRYLSSRKEAPWAVRLLIGRLTARVPLGELVDRFAEEGVPSGELAEKVMAHALSEGAKQKLTPGWTPWLLFFPINAAWFALITWVV